MKKIYCRYPKKFFLLFILSISFLQAGAQHKKYTLENADSLFKQYNLGESYAAYLSVANHPENPAADRAKACQKLAEQLWKFDRQYDDAMQTLRVATVLKTDLCGINLLRSSIGLQANKYNEAEGYAKQSLQLAKTETEKNDAGLMFARVIHKQNFDRLVKNAAINRKNLQQALSLLSGILEKQPGNSDASELMVGIGLFLGDGDAIIKGWKSYYLVSDEKTINEAIKPGFDIIKPIINNWKGKPLSAEAIKKLAIGFAASKFFDYAAYIIGDLKKRTPAVYNNSKPLQDIAAYAAYINAVQKVNDKIYPEVANGKTKYENEYDSLMNKAGKILWDKQSFIKKEKKFDPDTLYEILNRHYGTEGYTGHTVNYYGMLMGHIIHKELKQINQYGYSTKFTYISVDRLISRDFTSWYGTTNVGGWGDSTTIIQVRKAYMTEPFQSLSWMTDSAEHKKILAQIAQKKRDDLEICKKDQYVEPKYLALYLKFNEAAKLYKRLTTSGLKGIELNIAFIDQIFTLTIASTVFAHEGRHAIDQLYFPKEFKTFSDDERELRAKFSEVIFSLNPKMAFTGSILGSDLDENTNHGKANKRFRKIIVDWMVAHRSEINGLDKDTPLLMQFNLLTDQQLIEICKSADPMAKGK